MKVLGIFATFLVALMLAACGGGGGGSSSTPTTTQPTPAPSGDSTKPVLTLETSSPMSVTGTIVVTSNKDLLSNVQIGMKYRGMFVPGPTSLNQGSRGMTWKPLASSLPCNAVLDGTAYAADTSGNIGDPLNFTITTAACPTDWWPPKNVAPIGQKVVGVNALSGTAVLIGNLTWQAATKDGTIKFVDTGAVMAGFDTRPIIWAVHQYNYWCAIAVHKDDGSPIGIWIDAGSTCSSEAFDYVIGTQAGLIRHFVARNQCYELRWSQTAMTFTDNLMTACPQ